MIRNTVTEAAESIPEPIDPAELVTLAELAAEGFGHGGQFVKTPRDAIDALARQLDGAVVTDDLGRRCTDRDTARRLFAERDEAERRQREAANARRVEARKQPRRRPRGVPADRIPEGMSPAAWMTSQDPDLQRPSVHQQLLDEELAAGRRLIDKLRARP